MAMPATRRDRLRAELARDLLVTARRLLRRGGPEAVTLAAIARELGITAPAIYRYYDSRDTLILALARDIVNEVVAALRAAAERHPEDEVGRRLSDLIRAFPAWARRNTAEFGLVFGPPPPVSGHVQREINAEWVTAVGEVYGEWYVRWWRTHPFPVPAEEELDSSLRDQLDHYRGELRLDALPIGAVLVFLECWSRIYASTCLEAFAHLSAQFADITPMHERMCQELCDRLEIPYEPRTDLWEEPAS